MEPKSKPANPIGSLILWSLGSLLFLMLGSVNPELVSRTGPAVLIYVVPYAFMLILTPAALFLLVADYFYRAQFTPRNSQSKFLFWLVCAVSIFLIVQLAEAIVFRKSGYFLYLAVALVVFCAQVLSTIRFQKDKVGGRAKIISLTVGMVVATGSSLALSLTLGSDFTYRDPLPLGLLASIALFIIILELVKARFLVRVLVGSTASVFLLVVLFFNFGFAISTGLSWTPDYSVEILAKPETLGLLITSAACLLLFQVVYSSLSSRARPAGKSSQ
jgi:hypothetical protein